MIWIIAGGRNYRYSQEDYDWLDSLVTCYGRPDVVVHGGASGADAMAHYWGNMHLYKVKEFTAHWSSDGRAGGPIRNRRMATYAKDHGGGICVLFPGGRGTASMREEALRANLEIIEKTPDEIL